MSMPGKSFQNEPVDAHGIDVGVLGRIMAAQNISFVLPDKKNIAAFYAELLSNVPGVRSCRVCVGDSFSQEGAFDNETCSECESMRNAAEENTGLSHAAASGCAEGAIDRHVVALKTLDHHFGTFSFCIDRAGVFEPYKPFIGNLGNFVALTLENRLHRSELQQARDALERRVNERTEELRAAKAKLETQIEERGKIEEEIRNLNVELEQRVRDRTAELERKNDELEKLNRIFVGRELRMAELKERLRRLERELTRGTP